MICLLLSVFIGNEEVSYWLNRVAFLLGGIGVLLSFLIQT